MGTITLSVPDELKSRMDSTDWINWSSVARRAFSEALDDVSNLEDAKRLRILSEISPDDKRQVKDSVAKEVVQSIKKASDELRQGRRKAMTLDELDTLMGLK